MRQIWAKGCHTIFILVGLANAADQDHENKDRRILYQEVAKALKIEPTQTDRVAAIFAKEWQKSLP